MRVVLWVWVNLTLVLILGLLYGASLLEIRYRVAVPAKEAPVSVDIDDPGIFQPLPSAPPCPRLCSSPSSCSCGSVLSGMRE
jgi:hypothetical protein